MTLGYFRQLTSALPDNSVIAVLRGELLDDVQAVHRIPNVGIAIETRDVRNDTPCPKDSEGSL